LHYYDEIRLLSPSHRTETGYRLYVEDDVIRLQQIVSLRQIGFSLEQIRDCLEQCEFSPHYVVQLHLSQLSEAVKALAWRSLELIQEFTGGDRGIEQSLNQMYQQEKPEIASRGAIDAAVMEYIGRARAALEQTG
jgi:DNA-binding transcriptional MerR regulator